MKKDGSERRGGGTPKDKTLRKCHEKLPLPSHCFWIGWDCWTEKLMQKKRLYCLFWIHLQLTVIWNFNYLKKLLNLIIFKKFLYIMKIKIRAFCSDGIFRCVPMPNHRGVQLWAVTLLHLLSPPIPSKCPPGSADQSLLAFRALTVFLLLFALSVLLMGRSRLIFCRFALTFFFEEDDFDWVESRINGSMGSL